MPTEQKPASMMDLVSADFKQKMELMKRGISPREVPVKPTKAELKLKAIQDGTLQPKRRGRPPKPKAFTPFRPSATPAFVAPLKEEYQLVPLPSTGRCACGGIPYTWSDKAHPALRYFCPSAKHGGNGRFWMAKNGEPTTIARVARRKAPEPLK